MNNLNCKCCNYQTIYSGTFKRHLKTKRHHRNAEKAIIYPKKSQSYPKLSQKVPKLSQVIPKSSHICRHCNKKYKYKGHLTRHLNTCSVLLLTQHNKLKEEKAEKEELEVKLKAEKAELEVKLKAEKEEKEDLLNFKVQLQQDKLTYMQKTKELELENELLKEKLYKSEHEVKDTEIKYLKKTGNTTNSHNNITQYITNKYPDAPNLQPIEKLDNYEKYATSSNDNKAVQNKSLTRLINDHFCNGVPPKKRSIWCIDTSRDKYIIKVDNKWETDIHGKEFCKHVMVPLGQQYLNYTSQIIDSKATGFVSRAIALQYFYLYITGMTKLPRTVHPLLAVKRKEEEEVV